MMQTLAAVAITWALLGHGLVWYQDIAAVVLMIAVVFVQRAQEPRVQRHSSISAQ